MATIAFYAGDGHTIEHTQGSGLGFFSGTFGSSVEVGAFQGATFITDSTGSTQGPTVDNIKYLNSHSGIVTGAPDGTGLKYIPNYRAPLNIRFTHASAVKTQNVRLRVFDRGNADYPASGVSTRIAELIHPNNTLTVQGSGDVIWWGDAAHDGTDVHDGMTGGANQDVRLGASAYTVGGTGIIVPLSDSPATSGEHCGTGSGSVITDTQHDWFLAISASPDSIGSKTSYGLYVSLEYL
jgi:hypothetical protein